MYEYTLYASYGRWSVDLGTRPSVRWLQAATLAEEDVEVRFSLQGGVELEDSSPMWRKILSSNRSTSGSDELGGKSKHVCVGQVRFAEH